MNDLNQMNHIEQMNQAITIPILPCRGIDETLEFYVAVGFEVTYEQGKPNSYACVRLGAIDLHFFSMSDYVPADSYSTCSVLVPDVEACHKAFSEGIRNHYGKRLSAGIPRITILRDKADGGRGFNLVDPGGNWIRFSQIGAQKSDEAKSKQSVSTKLSRALLGADFLAENKGDFAAAAKMLDAALAGDEAKPPLQLVTALVVRAGTALSMGEPDVARQCLLKMRQVPLTDEERSALADELERADDFEQMLA